MPQKVHFLKLLSFFCENLDVSEEHGKRFHQNIVVIEKRFQGKWCVEMLADTYCKVSLTSFIMFLALMMHISLQKCMSPVLVF